MTDGSTLALARSLLRRAGLRIPEPELQSLAEVLPELWRQADDVGAHLTGQHPDGPAAPGPGAVK